MAIPVVEDSSLIVYEKAAQHHHKNETLDELPETDFTLMFITRPELLGVRIKIKDEVPRGSLVADVAVIYQWHSPVTPDDAIDEFARTVAIPQVLAVAATVLSSAAEAVDTPVPFYALQTERLIEEFTSRKLTLSEVLRAQTEALGDDEPPEVTPS